MSTQPTRLPVRAEVAPYNGRPTLLINGQPQYPMLYALTDCPGGRMSWEEVPSWNIANFTRSGVRLFQVSVWLEHLWKEDGSFSVGLAQRQIRGILDICPDAVVFFRLHINAPMWWNRLHPEECTQYANGPLAEEVLPGLRRLIDRDLEPVPRASMASGLWREQTAQIIGRFCRELSQTPEGDRLAGIQMACGVFHEWHYWGFIDNEPDVSAPMTEYFRAWLKAKYGTEESLREAWGDATVSFANALVPGMEPRLHTGDGIFRNPQRERPVCDYFECQHQCVADDILFFCGLAKRCWPRPLVTGSFYGYFFTLFGRSITGGHLQIERVLRSPDIDYLCAPQSYNLNHRGMGGSGQSRGLLDSCRLNGKLWLDEMDTGTFLDALRKKELEGVNVTLEESIAIIQRNVAESFTKGMGLWFYDFGPTNISGWWDHTMLQREIARIKDLFEVYFRSEYRPQADVLLVYDTNVFYYLANNAERDPLTDPVAVNITSADAYRSGAIIDMIYLCDIDRVDFAQYKVVLFANTFFLKREQIEFIRSNVAAGGRHLLWMCAPGYTDGNRNDAGFIESVAGIRVRHLAGGAPGPVCPNGSFFDQEAPGGLAFGQAMDYSPVFAIDDDGADICGVFENTNIAALGKKRIGDSTSWFCSVPYQNPAMLRRIFAQAGVHIYNHGGDTLYSGSGVLCVHTLAGGNRRIVLKNGVATSAELAPRSTAYFDNETGERLL